MACAQHGLRQAAHASHGGGGQQLQLGVGQAGWVEGEKAESMGRAR